MLRLPHVVADEVAQRRRAEEVLSLLEISHLRHESVDDLAYGLQKRVEFGRALAQEPKLLLLDEPMAGMTVDEKEDMSAFILTARDQLDVTLVLVEHDMEVVMDIAERVVVLNFGRKIADATPGRGPARPGGDPGLPRRQPRDRRRSSRDGSPGAPARAGARDAVRRRAAAQGARDLGGDDLGAARRARRAARARARRVGCVGRRAVALVGDNSPDWIAVDLALQAVGARCVTPWPALAADALGDDLRRAGVELVVCGDEEQYDKLSGLRTIVIDDTGVDDETTLAEIAEAGAAEPLERYEALLAERGADDEVCIAFEAAGERAAVAHTSGALLAAAEAVASATALAPGDRTFCMLPLAALPARVFDVYAALVTGATVHVPESPASVPIDLAEVAPTALSASPRALELLRASVQVRAARSHGFKRRMQRWAREHPGDGGEGCWWPSPRRGCSGSGRRG